MYALPVLFAITLHEASHGYVARRFGDMTAAAAGRISLNPLRHIDPLGTIVLPVITLLIGGFMFGWAKPVPVRFDRLRNPKQDMIWVAAAGPLSNLAMALAWAVLLRLARELPPDSALLTWLALTCAAGIVVNAMFFALNLLPLPPLDGGRIVAGLLPSRAAIQFEQIERFGIIILIALMALKVLWLVLGPVVQFTVQLVCALTGNSDVQVLGLLFAL